MNFTKLTLSLATVAMGIASAASSYSVTFNAPTKVGATELKAGEYKVEMKGDKAVFKSGKNVVEVPATLATSEQKYSYTALSVVDAKLKEIELGGTKSKITFSTDAPATKGN